MPDFMPKNDTEYAAWLANFNTVATANLAALGLVTGDLTPSTAGTTAFNTAITTFVSAKASAKSATQGKKSSRKTIETVSRTLAKRIQANPAVSNSLKEQLGLTVRTAPSRAIAPANPFALVVTGFDNGVNALLWNRNGNAAGVQYVIEARIGNEAEFSMVGTTTKSKFEHGEQKPGVQAIYRVYAQRASIQSNVSNEAVVYAAFPIRVAAPLLRVA